MPRRKSTLGHREIDGKRYTWKAWGHSKARAREIAGNFRKLGYSVRVIPSKPSKKLNQIYDIYVRRKK